MDILVPMCGYGDRFVKAGYNVFKPLIPIGGVPMVKVGLDSLGFTGRFIFVIRKSCVGLADTLRELFHGCIVIEINGGTRGAADTCLRAREYISEDPLLIVNCDLVLRWCGTQFNEFLTNTTLDGVLVTYDCDSQKNSYARLDGKGLVKEVREKQVISRVSLNGIHYFKKGNSFIKCAEDAIEVGDFVNGEIYVGPVYNHLIKSGGRVGVYHIPVEQHWAVGTPEDLELYESLFVTGL